MEPSHRKLIANPPQNIRLKSTPLMDDLRMKFPEGWSVTGMRIIGDILDFKSNLVTSS